MLSMRTRIKAWKVSCEGKKLFHFSLFDEWGDFGSGWNRVRRKTVSCQLSSIVERSLVVCGGWVKQETFFMPVHAAVK